MKFKRGLVVLLFLMVLVGSLGFVESISYYEVFGCLEEPCPEYDFGLKVIEEDVFIIGYGNKEGSINYHKESVLSFLNDFKNKDGYRTYLSNVIPIESSWAIQAGGILYVQDELDSIRLNLEGGGYAILSLYELDEDYKIKNGHWWDPYVELRSGEESEKISPGVYYLSMQVGDNQIDWNNRVVSIEFMGTSLGYEGLLDHACGKGEYSRENFTGKDNLNMFSGSSPNLDNISEPSSRYPFYSFACEETPSKKFMVTQKVLHYRLIDQYFGEDAGKNFF